MLNILLWFSQIYLAYWFFQPAMMKLKMPQEKLAQMGLISANGSVVPIRILASLEFLGTFGIIVPWLFGFCKILTTFTFLPVIDYTKAYHFANIFPLTKILKTKLP